MSTAAAGGGKHEGRLFRLGMWLGHYASQTLTPINIIIWTWIVASWWLPRSIADSPLSYLSTGLVLIYLAMIFCEWQLHDRNLCLRDLNDVPLLDPQAAVDKNRARLRRYHDPRTRKIAIVVGMVPIAALLIMAGGRDYPTGLRLLMTVIAVAAVSAISYLSLDQRAHRRLRTWCPWCRRPDEDQDTKVPEPDPVGSADR